jgi:GT2 family glycosyltransferase
MPLFSVIIPTCHRPRALVRCLATLAPGAQAGMTLMHRNSANLDHQSSAAYEVIVTDDGSLNVEERILLEEFPWAQWVNGPKRGPAANRNHGAEGAAGDWLVFLDDDCIPEATLLAAYQSATASGCAVLEGMTLSEGTRNAADMESPVNTSGGHLWSCNFAIRRQVFAELGGFDENFVSPVMEDVEMLTRLSKAGYQTLFVSAASVLHPWRLRRGMKFEQSCARSMAYFLSKHPEERRWWSARSLLHRAAAALLLDLPRNLVRFRGRGAFRALFLDLVFLSLLATSLSVRWTQMEKHLVSKSSAP